MQPQNKTRYTVHALAEIAVMTAVLEAGKIALSFLPNIEIVSILIILYTRYFRGKVLPVIVLFVGMESLIWGFSSWIIMYLYIWPLLALIAYLFRSQDSPIFWAVVSGIFGLLFGALCSIVYLFIGGLNTAIAWWIAGLPFDFIHCFGNVVTALALFKPLDAILKRYRNHQIVNY